MVRHPPINNQRSTAFFLSLGFYDVFVRRLHRTYRERWNVMGEALKEHFPDAAVTRGMGGSSYWVDIGDAENGRAIDTETLAEQSLKAGILIEPGAVYFDGLQSKSCMRLGFSSIPTANISDGLSELKRVAKTLSPTGCAASVFGLPTSAASNTA